jgi:signal transduction histidine kinase
VEEESQEERPYARSWPALAIAFGALLLLMALAGREVIARSRQVEETIAHLQAAQNATRAQLSELRLDRVELALLLRDYVLATSHEAQDQIRVELGEVRARIENNAQKLRQSVGTNENTQRMDAILAETWELLRPVQAGSAAVDRESAARLRREFLSALNQLESVLDQKLAAQQQELRAQQAQSNTGIRRVVVGTVALGVLVSFLAIGRTWHLERRAERLWIVNDHAERELRQLSNRLLRGQEDERKRISRELHDEIGQLLTALRMELGNLERLRLSDREFLSHSAQAKRLAESTLRSIRSLAQGLRPPMLDDLGLTPALEWLTREFTRKTQIPVDLHTDGDLDSVPEQHSTCLYRIVQEALSNSARHANATQIRITVHGGADAVRLTVQDDGLGFSHNGKIDGGVGLIGIEERVRELNGRLRLHSQPNRGTLLSAELPLPGGILN